MLIFQIKRIVSSEKWFNYVVTFFFFLKVPKIWVGRTTLNGEKRGWPSNNKCKVLSVLGQTEQVVGKLNWNPSQFGRNHVQIC